MLKGFFVSSVFSVLIAQGVFAEESSSKLSPLKIFANWETSEVESFHPDGSSTAAGYPRELSTASSVWLLVTRAK